VYSRFPRSVLESGFESNGGAGEMRDRKLIPSNGLRDGRLRMSENAEAMKIRRERACFS